MNKKEKEDQKEFNYKNNIKNTYINKINSLITNNVPAQALTTAKNEEDQKSPLKY